MRMKAVAVLPIALMLADCGRGGDTAGRAGAGPGIRPNVLLVTIDTLRADHLGCYGHRAAITPTLHGPPRGRSVLSLGALPRPPRPVRASGRARPEVPGRALRRRDRVRGRPARAALARARGEGPAPADARPRHRRSR